MLTAAAAGVAAFVVGMGFFILLCLDCDNEPRVGGGYRRSRRNRRNRRNRR
jgi:hypothetical protein